MTLVMPGDELRERTVRLDGTGDHWAQTASGLVVPTYAAQPAPLELPVAVDLFCGAGGFSVGIHQAGFQVAVAVEEWRPAALTYLVNLGGPDTLVVPLDDLTIKRRRNRSGHDFEPGTYTAGEPYPCSEILPTAGTGWISSPELDHEPGTCAHHIADLDGVDDPDKRLWFCRTYHTPPVHREPCKVFYLGDIRRLAGATILDALGRDDVDCVVGGPPCQGFSKASGRSPEQLRHDGRNLLVFEFARIVLETRAKTMVMENVPQILTMLTPEGIPVIDALSRILADGGFSTYDAIRKSLLANAGDGAGGAMRRDRATPKDTTESEPEPELTLFDEAVA